jgi:hypothetical protein
MADAMVIALIARPTSTLSPEATAVSGDLPPSSGSGDESKWISSSGDIA